MAGPVSMSTLDIWNVCLSTLGLDTLASTGGSSSKHVKLAARWPSIRYEFISKFEWNGAKQTLEEADFTAVTTPDPPSTRWSHVYSLQGVENLIRVLRVNSGRREIRSVNHPLTRWEIEQKHDATADGESQELWLLTDEVVKDVEVLLDIPADPGGASEATIGALLGPQVAVALGYYMAGELASTLARDPAVEGQVRETAMRKIMDAMTVDSQTGSALRFRDDRLVRARGAGQYGGPHDRYYNS